MSNKMNTSPTIRWQLLSTVSALALLTSTYAAGAAGSDAYRPLIWIELGGQMENVSGQGEVFAPAFLAANPNSPVLGSVTPLQAQRPPKFSFGEEGSISFQPEDSNWIFSAAVRIGRSSDFRHVDHQTQATRYKYLFGNRGYSTTKVDFADTKAHHRENHGILDFTAGKDVGLGMFGNDSSSEVSLGVRFAQFASKASFDIRARPDVQVKYATYAPIGFKKALLSFHDYHATGEAERDFHGVGPSLSWKGSAALAGNQQNGEITLDWGANAALLFGRQKARVQHQESADHWDAIHQQKYYVYVYNHPSNGHPTHGHTTDRSVTVPNVGGFAGLSYRYAEAKISLGYRADFFFGAMDTGIDAAKKSDMAFKGPYANISVGLGD